MLIVLEGPDGAGKSTLAREIALYLRNRYRIGRQVIELHRGPPTQHPLDEYELPLLDYDAKTQHIICDRWHLGEAVYPHVLNRATKWNIAIERYLHMFMQARGACVVMLQPDVDELKTRISIRGDQLITSSQLSSVVRLYNMLDSRYFNVNYGTNVPELLTPRALTRLAQQLMYKAHNLPKFKTYVGPPDPSTLLFGDVRAERAQRERPGMPAFCPYPSTSGAYLLTHLDVVEHNAGIANACDVDDPRELHCELMFPATVALGRAASQRLTELKIPHGAVPHPQYVRRFHYNRGREYANLILEAATTGKDLSVWLRS